MSAGGVRALRVVAECAKRGFKDFAKELAKEQAKTILAEETGLDRGATKGVAVHSAMHGGAKVELANTILTEIRHKVTDYVKGNIPSENAPVPAPVLETTSSKMGDKPVIPVHFNQKPKAVIPSIQKENSTLIFHMESSLKHFKAPTAPFDVTLMERSFVTSIKNIEQNTTLKSQKDSSTSSLQPQRNEHHQELEKILGARMAEALTFNIRNPL